MGQKVEIENSKLNTSNTMNDEEVDMVQTGSTEPVPNEPVPNMSRDLEYRLELTNSRGVSDFTNRVLAVIQRWGFTDYSFYRLPNRVPVRKAMITTMKELQEIYNEGRHIKYDLMLMHAQCKSVPTYLSIIDDFISTVQFDNELFIRNRELIRLYRCFGYSDIYCIPVKAHDGDGRVVLMVLAEGVGRQKFKELIENKKTELRALTTAIDYIGGNKYPEHFCSIDDSSTNTISARPLELLNTLAKDNISLKHAAEKMFISLDTANKHMASVKRVLGANTQASAVYLALERGLITFED